ncbi:hypothetical protein RhiirA5_505776 [Rhizophagus irregularis]|uniref:Uncharacterized protein n=1 Tax=Rhizophagus irregularis TaxID=588596 RepID=A0A2N0NXJ9_9GLOM|nr:hypothetical protein RhiirA5_505776 [Rhizophagus irregularis]
MQYKQYRLQILVNGMPLEECWEPLDSNDNKLSSYTRDNITNLKYESESIHYAAVNVDHGTRFSVRFSAEDATKDEPIKAYLSVDGNWDFTYYQLYNEKFCRANGFWNKDRNKKYYFKFIQTTSSSSSDTNNSITNVNEETNADIEETNIDSKKANIDSKENETNKETNVNSNETNIKEKGPNDNRFSLMKSSGPGCVSVYFYRAKWVNQQCKVPNFIINKTSNAEDISLYTGFDEEFDDQNFIQNGVVNLRRISKNPIAELHIHYRDISYLTDRGFIFPNLNTPKSDLIREDYFENITTNKENRLIKYVKPTIIITSHFDQTGLNDREESNLIKKERSDKVFLTVEKSNKRSFDPDEEESINKRVKYDVTEGKLTKM